jgi:hypothetical protein
MMNSAVVAQFVKSYVEEIGFAEEEIGFPSEPSSPQSSVDEDMDDDNLSVKFTLKLEGIHCNFCSRYNWKFEVIHYYFDSKNNGNYYDLNRFTIMRRNSLEF